VGYQRKLAQASAASQAFGAAGFTENHPNGLAATLAEWKNLPIAFRTKAVGEVNRVDVGDVLAAHPQVGLAEGELREQPFDMLHNFEFGGIAARNMLLLILAQIEVLEDGGGEIVESLFLLYR